MPVTVTADIQPLTYDTSIRELLARSGLPVADLGGGNSSVRWFGCVQNGVVTGVVGLEVYGAHALLRSLAVAPFRRGEGLGTALIAYAERQAAHAGAERVYLLTDTAQALFEHSGYVRVRREDAPESIANTSLFARLCPASSAFMSKVI